MSDEPQYVVTVYAGDKDPYIFNWGGFQFQVHRGAPPDNKPPVDPPGPPMVAWSDLPGSRVSIYPIPTDYTIPPETTIRNPETVGVIADPESVRLAISSRLAYTNRPYRIMIDMFDLGHQLAGLSPLLEGIETAAGSDTEVFLIVGSEREGG